MKKPLIRNIRQLVLGAVFLLPLFLVSQSVFADAPGIPAAQQSSQQDPVYYIIWLGCGGIVIFSGLFLRVAYSSFAPNLDQRVSTKKSVNQILAIVDQIYPERQWFGYPWQRKRSKVQFDMLELRAYPLPYVAFCCLIPLTGLLLGAVGWLIMGRRDRVTITTADDPEGTIVTISAVGFNAVSKTKNFIAML